MAQMQGSLGQEVKIPHPLETAGKFVGPIIMASQLLRSSSWALLLPGHVGRPWFLQCLSLKFHLERNVTAHPHT